MHSTQRIMDDPTVTTRYLAGDLPADEADKLEQEFLSNPQAAQELEATARMMVGLANLRDSRQLPGIVSSGASTQRRSALVAIAASLTIAVLGLVIWRAAEGPQQALLVASKAALRSQAGKPLDLGASYALLRTRASDHDAELQLPATPQAIELRVRPELLAETYRATLARIGEDGSVNQVAVIDGLRVDSDRFVRMYLDSSKLAAGPYLLILSVPDSRRGEPATSSFRLKVTQEE